LERRCLKLCKDELLPHFKQSIVETQLAVRDYFKGEGGVEIIYSANWNYCSSGLKATVFRCGV